MTYVEEAVGDFREKLVVPLFADITRTLEVTCHKPGSANHGSNFIGNAVVLSGIEAVSQFIDPATEQQRKCFKEQADQIYGSIDPEKKMYLMPRHGPSEGAELAKTLMKKYFDSSVFQKKELGVPLCELIWAFRNPHMHAFYPYCQKKFNERKVSGGVKWLYREPVGRVGIAIEEIECDFQTWRESLYGVDGDSFWICPQILFVFFKQAVNRFIEEVGNAPEVRESFVQNYERLTECYGFGPRELPS